jgi:hypothetical protein
LHLSANEVIEIGSASQPAMEDEARRWIGHPVCVVLRDGRYYVGWIAEVDADGLTLRGKPGRGRLGPHALRRQEKARASALFPTSPAAGFAGGFPFEGAGAFPFGGAPGGLGGWFGQGNAEGGAGLLGMIGKAWPGIKMGFGIMRMIMPLLGGLKI